jgi:hypothetical protein
MSYRNKTYVAFDGDTDIACYRLMKAWKQNEHIDFNFFDAHDLNSARDSSTEESIKAQLRLRMVESKQMVLLVGEKTRLLRKFIPWEIELARKKGIPIVVANLNGHREYDDTRCPGALKDNVYTVSVSFQPKIVQFALDAFPTQFANLKNAQGYDHRHHYGSDVYKSLGLG